MDWYGILKAARGVGSREERRSGKRFIVAIPFTAAQFAADAEFKATKKSSSADIAAGWISKLVRWGYVKRVDPPSDHEIQRNPKGGRPVQFYELTTWGLTKKAPKRKYWEAFEGTEKPVKRKEGQKPTSVAANPHEE